MARVDLPPSRLKARKRRRRLIFAGIVLVILVVLVAGLVALLHAPFLRITTITITGSRTLASTTLEAAVQAELAGSYWYVLPRDNIFIYPNAQIVAALQKQFPVLYSAEVRAQDFHTITVTVVEREPVALWCGDACYFMDERGVVYAPAGDPAPETMVQYFGKASSTVPRQYLSPEHYGSLAALVGALTQSQPGDPVQSVAVDDNGDVRAYFHNDFLLIFALTDAGGDVFERFMLALKSDPFKNHTVSDFEYLDLRWGDKLYYKLK